MVTTCPACESIFSEAQPDYPHLSECDTCGSEWVTETGEVLFNAKEDL